jgi:hypothetical protein
MPLTLTGLIFLWTWIVAPYSKYGDNWAVVPVIVLFAAVILWHLGLIVTQKEKLLCISYGVVHVAILFRPWIYCLMKLSKDSL